MNDDVPTGRLRDIPHRRWKDYPKPGVDYPDSAIMTCEPEDAAHVVSELVAALPAEAELLAGIDIGGLGFAGALACTRGIGFIDIRKVAALRPEVVGSILSNYDLGFGVAISKGNRLAGRTAIVIDDCLISGTTAVAAVQLLRHLGARCHHALFVFEIDGMGGRERLRQVGVATTALRTVPPREPA